MKHKEEDLQNQFERGDFSGEGIDAQAYQKVFDALKKEPYHLPSHFADRVMLRIDAQESLSKDYFWFGLGLFTLIAGACVAALLANFKLDFGTFKFISGYPGLFLFGVMFIALIHYVDKRFLSRMISNR